jgi:hypothetical protein
MEAIRAYFDGRAFVPTKPVSIRRNQPVLVTILGVSDDNSTKKRLLSFAGALDEDDYRNFEEALKDTERIDYDEW